MATATIVITYTPGVAEGTGEKGPVVTSATFGGTGLTGATAYGSLTAQNAKDIYVLSKQLASLIAKDKLSTGVRDTEIVA